MNITKKVKFIRSAFVVRRKAIFTVLKERRNLATNIFIEQNVS